MKAHILMILLFLLAGCSGRNSGPPKQETPSDSLKVADSTSAGDVAQPEMTLTYEERQGKYVYERYCAVCHGQEGKGDGFNAFNLDPRPRDFSDSTYLKALGDAQTFETISGGGRSVNKSPLMPSYGWTLKREEIRYIVSYLKTFSTRK